MAGSSPAMTTQLGRRACYEIPDTGQGRFRDDTIRAGRRFTPHRVRDDSFHLKSSWSSRLPPLVAPPPFRLCGDKDPRSRSGPKAAAGTRPRVKDPRRDA